jgi:UDP-N-acetylmuramoylalanine--D-glutamate ligase
VNTIVTDKKVVVVGLGKTGLSCVRHLAKSACHLSVMDSREAPPGMDDLIENFPNVALLKGGFDRDILCAASEIILSPGVPLANEDIQAAINAGVPVRGDIDVFAEAANAPIVAITGSNGKSTVTTLLGDMANAAGLKVGVGGNLGTPALDLLSEDKALYVLELSSFQLETTHRLNAACAVILNLSEDHMDRYESKIAYLQAKQRIFHGAKHVVINDDEVLSQPMVAEGMGLIHFGIAKPDLKKFSTQYIEGIDSLVHGFNYLMPVSELKVRGEHNVSNVLAAMALASAVDIPVPAMLQAARNFTGLSHRCRYVRTVGGVDYINDSKGTNAGATETAINSLGAQAQGKIILIAGGDSKGADLSCLAEPMHRYGRLAVLIGRDAPLVAKAIEASTEVTFEQSLESAVAKANELAEEGDVVLLSPACASFDMFSSYEHRGDIFEQEVAKL